MSSLMYLLGVSGFTTIQSYLAIGLIGGGFTAIGSLQFMKKRKEQYYENLAEENKRIEIERKHLNLEQWTLEEETENIRLKKLELKKKQLENASWNEKEAIESIRISKEHARLIEQKKQDEIDASNLSKEKPNVILTFQYLKVPNKKALLWGYTKDGHPLWGYEVNYIIAGTTRMGKTRKLHVLLLNFLKNRQGIVFIVDLKGTDYILYDGVPGVVCRVTAIDHVAEAVMGFEKEYNRRKEIINAGYIDKMGKHRPYLDIEDYNQLNPDKPLKDFMLLVDEFADISDVYSTQQGVPVGCYAKIIELARKCGAMGGRIVMGTQRPSRDVIIGTLKNNCNLIGLTCLNEINSKIVIDVGGCEKLAKTEALGYFDTKLKKIYAYQISNADLINNTDQLKNNSNHH